MDSRESKELRRVCLAISAFRSDEAVLRLLESVHERGTPPFSSVIVVDSQGSGNIEAAISTQGWTTVRYLNSPTNLGSAGNFAKRLELAAQTPAEFVFAINHDGRVDLDVIAALVDLADRVPKVGAVYPLRRYVHKGGRYDRTGERRTPTIFRGGTEPPGDETSETFWSSSNASLYALEPVRQGLLPWADLWMGWEDLGYGLLLAKNGYRQVVANRVVLDDDYEYAEKRIGPLKLHIADKPSWYEYYLARNLILVADRTDQRRRSALGKIVMEAGTIAMLRRGKGERLRLLVRGVLDGLRGTTGRGAVP